MNKVFPRKLWVMTVNKCAAGTLYRGMKMITQDDLVLDPLQVLRCDKRIFRCAPLLEVILYMLKATLAASRTHLAQHIQNNPIIERAANAQISNDMEREELKIALVASQESAAVQILLETGMARSEEKAELSESSLLTNLKEVQSLICSYLHEAFITDPNLAKLVHFQVRNNLTIWSQFKRRRKVLLTLRWKRNSSQFPFCSRAILSSYFRSQLQEFRRFTFAWTSLPSF